MAHCCATFRDTAHGRSDGVVLLFAGGTLAAGVAGRKVGFFYFPVLIKVPLEGASIAILRVHTYIHTSCTHAQQTDENSYTTHAFLRSRAASPVTFPSRSRSSPAERETGKSRNREAALSFGALFVPDLRGLPRRRSNEADSNQNRPLWRARGLLVAAKLSSRQSLPIAESLPSVADHPPQTLQTMSVDTRWESRHRACHARLQLEISRNNREAVRA